jgi:glucose/arabinose dehydrogenase
VPRLRRAVLALAGVLLLAGCGAAANAHSPTWVPKPSFAGEALPPAAPGSVEPNPGPSRPSPHGPPGKPSKAIDPYVVATKLAAPTGVALLPDGSALVGERTTGRIVRVQPTPGRPVPTVRTLRGLSTTGGGGLLDLALSPNYAQDGLIFAYLSTPTDNRVVAFTLSGPATPVLVAIPRGPSDNAGRIAFGTDGLLYVGTGDAGRPALAADPHSLAGKVLRVTDIGKPAAGGRAPSSRVFTSGHHVVDGLCLVAETNTMVEVEAHGSDGTDHVNVLTGGSSYGWPRPSNSSQAPTATLPNGYGGPGGCAVLDGRLYVTSLDGKALLAAALSATGSKLSAGSFGSALANTYGRLLTVVADPAGYLWLTTSNRDGHGRPVAADERVLRVPPPQNSSNSPA